MTHMGLIEAHFVLSEWARYDPRLTVDSVGDGGALSGMFNNVALFQFSIQIFVSTIAECFGRFAKVLTVYVL